MILGFTLAACAGETSLYDPVVVQMYYGVFLASGMFTVIIIAEFWVETLPFQVRRLCEDLKHFTGGACQI